MNDPKTAPRGGMQEVSLVLENGATRPVIGTSQPAHEEDAALQARVRAARHWGARPSPRQAAEGGITEPLDPRTRTVLAHRLPQQQRRQLDEGLTDTSKVPESGVVGTAKLHRSGR